MTHIYGHLECGGAGPELGIKQIDIHDHKYLNVADHLKHDELVAKLVSDGVPQAKAEKMVTRLGERIHRDVEGWYEFFEDHDIETHYHVPLPQNFP